MASRTLTAFVRRSASLTSSPASSTRFSSSSALTSNQTLRAALLLTRAPYLTPEEHPLATAYHAYNRRLSLALSSPFPTEFYYQKGSLAERRFLAREARRRAEELGAKMPEIEEDLGEEEEVVPLPREEKAGAGKGAGDLERWGGRSVSLVLKGKSGWELPVAVVAEKETLHAAALRATHEALGPDLDIWLVSKAPIAHWSTSPSEKTYLFTAHILAGAASSSARAHAWLTKEEVLRDTKAEDTERWGELLPLV